MRTSRIGIALAIFVCLPLTSMAQIANGVRIMNVRLFDGEHVHAPTNVAVEGGFIRAIGADIDEYNRLPAVDGTGATLLPGLIDAHVHTRASDELRQALRFGVTTALDMGAVLEPQELFALREQSRVGADMAELRVAGYLATARSPQEPGSLTTRSTPQVATEEDARQFAALRRAEGVDHIKIILRGGQTAATGVPNLDEPRVRALTEGAHVNGLLAVAHIETVEDARAAMSGGVDGLVHTWRTGGALPELARQVVERNMFVVATLVGPDAFLAESRAALLAEPRFQSFVSDGIRTQLSPSRVFPPASPASAPPEARRAAFEAQLAAVRSLHGAGAKFLAGSDASANVVAFGISLHRELELLHLAGLTPTEVLAAATSNTADTFRLNDRGRVTPGKRADLLLVRGDPTTDILATRDIQKVWKAGTELGRTD
jgi:imidazolonepropionase-like amidohydrolase